MKQDLQKFNRTVTKFIADHYHELINLTANKTALVEFIKDGFKEVSVSNAYLDKMLDTLEKNSSAKNQSYLTNVMLKGNGLGIS